MTQDDDNDVPQHLFDCFLYDVHYASNIVNKFGSINQFISGYIPSKETGEMQRNTLYYMHFVLSVLWTVDTNVSF